ncbi:MAG: RNA methyltransferase [Deltaproteobacteria bacterium]|nr:RNA methyltransferase [Deltaproteobacteria bacterium]
MMTLPLSTQHRKWIRKLHQKKYRREEQLFIAEGVNSLHAALDAPHHPVREIIVDHDFADRIRDNPSAFPLPSMIPVYECSSNDMEVISSEETPQGIIIVCQQKEFRIDDGAGRLGGMVIYCEEISDPGNLGAIIRSSAWFGFSTILVGPFCVDPFNTKVIRSSAGAIFGVEVYQLVHCDGPVEIAARDGYTLTATVPEGGIPLHQWKQSGKTILMFGHETKGLSPQLIERADQRISIPGCGAIESLNLSVAASIIFYETAVRWNSRETGCNYLTER